MLNKKTHTREKKMLKNRNYERGTKGIFWRNNDENEWNIDRN